MQNFYKTNHLKGRNLYVRKKICKENSSGGITCNDGDDRMWKSSGDTDTKTKENDSKAEVTKEETKKRRKQRTDRIFLAYPDEEEM